jgi:hypothetical protein
MRLFRLDASPLFPVTRSRASASILAIMSADDLVKALRQQLADAIIREGSILSHLQNGANVRERRAALGNPFFYSGGRHDVPEHQATSRARFTGYQSHAPALALLRDYQRVRHEIAMLQEELRRHGPLRE